MDNVVRFKRFRVAQVPSYTGISGPSGTTGTLTPEEMRAHLKVFIPIWKKVAKNQDYPSRIELIGKHEEEWYIATRLYPGSLNPTMPSWPTLEELGLK
jgi:hypothetical protein